jgi:hypothetical protein
VGSLSNNQTLVTGGSEPSSLAITVTAETLAIHDPGFRVE